ncbi:amidohydrolase family protein [Leucobacter sp. CSA2]|uniref:Amidohydrolase family protein n=1 Tax=Leucobacter edaphi TaxID=2796472 RepID=A0A934QCZ2_9MICO|nr:amidohydrolase family protein [Leucobacter edaphi]MBK0422183.1 amidohydrolase family protein [Leucobacter edaphi]
MTSPATTGVTVTLIRNARFLGSETRYDLGLRDGKIAWVARAGERDGSPDVSGRAGEARDADAAAVLDADGRFVTSGLWDEHVHFGQWALAADRLDLASAESADQALELIAAACASAESSGRERNGGSGPQELVAVRARAASWPAPISRAALDRVTGERPTVVIGADLHGCWLNSAALARRGITSAGDGHIVEDDCFALVRELDRMSDAERDALASRAAAAASARGVVGIVDFEMRWGLTDWARREADGFRLLRVESAIYPQDLERALEEGRRTGDPLADGLTRVGPLKIVTDGSLGTMTAWCCEPYPVSTEEPAAGSGTAAERDPAYSGRSLVPGEELRRLMRRASDGGLELAIHAIGDRANAEVLDAFEELGIPGMIEHAQLLRPEDIERFGPLGVVASVQPEHLLDDRETTDRLWPRRAGDAYPFARLSRAGARLILGSDAPVAPLDPWRGIAAAVTRRRGSDAPWFPGERLTADEAISACMRGGLRPSPGDEADLILLDTDPLAADPDALDRTPVAATLLAGRLTHLDDGLASRLDFLG